MMKIKKLPLAVTLLLQASSASFCMMPQQEQTRITHSIKYSHKELLDMRREKQNNPKWILALVHKEPQIKPEIFCQVCKPELLCMPLDKTTGDTLLHFVVRNNDVTAATFLLPLYAYMQIDVENIVNTEGATPSQLNEHLLQTPESPTAFLAQDYIWNLFHPKMR